ncbi:hypothetical protein ASF53_02185 [Methylobacterium sp. Leaf123]|uniref:hypothetical protein n=1 Tax=Methylobacterium sp. Leaf123 TaxID=1736264 RepID=UPI000700CFC8|nr:hypothetical protein [Methylobacterium sp. Leaf123]KQQ31530.1 hypothetical protein ASF53_02185 [Methylobacterium sp. Leaf123]
MIQRARIKPVEPLARRLVRKPPAARASRGAAIAALQADGEFPFEDIEDSIDLVMSRAAQLVVAAASDRPWALRLGHLRDLVSLCVVAGGIVYGWGVLS